MPIAIYIEYVPREGCRARLIQGLQEDASKSMREDEGCLRMELAVPAPDDGRIFLVELWRDEAAIESHRTKPGHSHAWQEALLASKRVTKCTVLSSPSKHDS